MITIYTDRRMIDHRTPSGHPERPARLAALLDHWDAIKLFDHVRRGTFVEVAPADLRRVHSADYLDDVETESHRARDEKPIMLDPDTYLAGHSMLAACLATGAAVAAVEQVAKSTGPETGKAFCAVRPPGHHARPKQAMGFCIYATAAVAAAHARDVLRLDRILVVDFDVHHGNGTQEIFYDDDRVGFFSIHRFPFYPGTGRADETGTGKGLGYTWNAPLPANTPASKFHDTFEAMLDKAAAKMKPQLVIISAGFDAHRLDPVGGLNLESEDYIRITRKVMQVADASCGGRIVSLLEGGYNVEKLVESATFHVKTLAGLATS
ncbi:MAG: histone deacetylase [Isosphaeraceae bacterium]